jgi:hypothetical protein
MMLIVRKSQLTGVERAIELPINELHLERWERGQLIQDAMPHLTPAQREFVMSGITEEEWAEMVREEV